MTASSSRLDQLRKITTVVADTGDLDAVRTFQPTDCTTNPSLILKAVQMERYRPLVDEAIAWARKTGAKGEALVSETVDRLSVVFGVELSKLVPGLVSTEVDADLSFDAQGTMEKARRLLALYREKGLGQERILIKIAATWEGIEAARQLEKEGIRCNMTLLFSLAQAMACAQAGVFLISPFVGRIMDWHAKAQGRTFAAHEDPGVQTIRTIYAHYKSLGYKTVVMVAAFRNAGQVLELAGCDRMTIPPAQLEELAKTQGDVPVKLSPALVKDIPVRRMDLDEKAFRWAMNQDAMATEKLAEGIRNFAADLEKVKVIVRGLV
ncbi:MAG: transaldolase [Pseudomonadota bacterium]|nr:transaldolase [Pseudomonadota bacterium]